jgi:hypothetical protein
MKVTGLVSICIWFQFGKKHSEEPPVDFGFFFA